MLSRRGFVRISAGAALASPACSTPEPRAPAPDSLIDQIDVSAIWHGRDTDYTWFHPRPCLVPGEPQSKLLMAVQTISGSDVFGPVHWSESTDLGETWSDPVPIPGLGRTKHPDGVEEGVCDTVPQHHPQTDSVIFMGWNVYYLDNRLTRPNEQRWPVYLVRHADGSWSEPRKLEWDNPAAGRIYGSNCSQRITLPSGEVLVPLTYASYERTDRVVGTVLCSFDGDTLRVERAGNQLELDVKRGLLEPSLANFGGRYYMTIRAEDERGYVSVSDDGLEWGPKKPWTWENGEPLVMSTTQQHWLEHSDGLYLVYTRKAEANANVMRWRAPLYVARVDPQSTEGVVLLRDTEQILIPMKGDGINEPEQVSRMGNFHVVAASADRSLVTVAETIPSRGWIGDTLQATIRWKTPNRLVS